MPITLWIAAPRHRWTGSKRTWAKQRIQQLTGNRIEDHPTLVNLLWEKSNRPDTYRTIWKALTIDGFITLKLTGQPVANYGAAAFYGVAYDLVGKRFDEALLAEIGIDPAILPRLARCEAIVGAVTPEAAAATGLAAGTPVAAGQVDFNASCVAAGITEEGDIMSNLGTVGNFGVIHRNPAFNFSPVGLSMINFAFTIDSANTYITVPSTTTGGQSIRYLRDNFSQYEIEVERVLGVSSYDLLNLQAEKIAPGSDGLIILPYLMGERTPIWDVHARGVVFGLSLNHGKGHLVRAMMEAVAYALYDSVPAYHPIRAQDQLSPGLERRRRGQQTVAADHHGRLRHAHGAGQAPHRRTVWRRHPGRRRHRRLRRILEWPRQWSDYVAVMEPDPEHHARYMDYFALYKQLYEHVKGDYVALAHLRDKYV